MAFEFTIEAHTDRFLDTDERWRRQVVDLHTDLRETGALRSDQRPAEGAKGTTEIVIMALTSASTLTAAIQALRAWLGRDRTRSLDITWTVDGVEHRLTAKGDALDAAPFKALADAVGERLTDQK